MSAKGSPSAALVKKKKKFLDLVADGNPISRCCEILGIADSTYYRWRSKDEDFKNRVDEAKVDPDRRRLLKLKKSQSSEVGSSGWRDDFVTAYRKTGSRSRAADFAHLSAAVVEDLLDPAHEKFDKEFASMVHEVEIRLLWDVEDNLMSKAKADPKSAQFILESRMRDRYGRKGALDGASGGVFWFTKSGEQEAENVLKNMFGKKRVKEIEA